MTRGRVARDVREGTTSQKDMTSRAQAQKQPESRVHTLRVFVFVFVIRESFITLVELFRVS